MTQHAKLSPSASTMWGNCPPSAAAQLQHEDVTSEPAAEGTFGHDVGARCLTDRISATAFLQRNPGWTDTVEGFTFTMDGAMASDLDVYTDYCLDLIRRADYWRIETRVCTGIDDLWGTGDLLVWIGSILYVVDLKFGRGIYVNASTGLPQLRCYGVGALATFPKRAQRIEKVVLVIVQPRHFRAQVHDCVSAETLTVAELMAWKTEWLIPRAAATRDPNAERVAGEHCYFCLDKPSCGTFRAKALEGAQSVFSNTETFEVVETPPDPAGMNLVQLGAALDAFPAVEAWIAAIRGHAYTMAAKHDIPGHKLVSKLANRAWKDKDAAAFVLDTLDIDPLTKPEPKIVTPAEADRRAKKLDPGLTADELERVAGLAHKQSSGTTLVPTSDSRAAIPIANLDVFGTLTDDGKPVTSDS